MRLYGFEPHKYSHAGSTVLFKGAAVHESLPWKDPGDRVVFKVAFFLDGDIKNGRHICKIKSGEGHGHYR